MKRLTVLPFIFAVFANTAIAADKIGDLCQSVGSISQTANGEILSCVDGKWETPAHLSNIIIGLQLLEDEKPLVSTHVLTQDGQPVPFSVGSERPYTASTEKKGNKTVYTTGTVKDGFFATLKPTINRDGKIEVEFSAKKSTVDSIQSISYGDLNVDLPQLSSIELKQKLALNSGEEIAIPFGTLVNPTKFGISMHTQYTLKISAYLDSQTPKSKSTSN